MSEGTGGGETEQLIVEFAARVVTRTIAEGEFLIGRGTDCFVWLADSSVSGHHARVLPRRAATGGYEWGVQDQSRYGTWVDGGRTRLGPTVHWFDRAIELRLYDPAHGPRITLLIQRASATEAPRRPALAHILAPADVQVLGGVRAGMKDKEIAARLGLQPGAVEKRLSRLRDKIEELQPGRRVTRVRLAEIARELDIESLS
jgi:hypothetical protein